MDVSSQLSLNGDLDSEKTKSITDVVWDIESFKFKRLAIEFALKIKQYFCVYSSVLTHVYGDYKVEVIRGARTRLVVVPETYSFDRYINILEDSVTPTYVHVYPGWYFNLSCAYAMTLPLQGKRSRPIPMSVGLKMLEEKTGTFLPLLRNGDLREFDQRTPYLHLHMLNLQSVKSLSDFDMSQLRGLIKDKLSGLPA